jgi:hypothetical protein
MKQSTTALLRDSAHVTSPRKPHTCNNILPTIMCVLTIILLFQASTAVVILTILFYPSL